MAIFVGGADASWIVITNALLGILVLLSLLAVMGAIAHRFAANIWHRNKAMREADSDLRAMFGRGRR